MGKKGYNWRARSAAKIEIDDRPSKLISVDIDHRKESYDQCNTLVLPSKKRRTIKKDKQTQHVRLLTKKKRKELEKVLERKEKKLQRVSLLEDLEKVQATPEELSQYVSITTIQTKGLKRHLREQSAAERPRGVEVIEEEITEDENVNAIKGNKRMRLLALDEEVKSKAARDPNVVGFDSESSGDDSEDEESSAEEPQQPLSAVPEEIREDASSEFDKRELINEEDCKQSKRFVRTKINPEDRKPAVFVTLNRKPEIQEARLKLPVLAEEQLIVEAIKENPVVIITGETGSGKTTQVPQFLYEAGYAKMRLIGITEPRRVAAISMSRRVAEEMNLTADEVSYLIRFEGNTTDRTKIKFMTDGVLLKEVQADFLLTKYSVIILDEAHERSVYTDILIGLLSRIVPLRAKRNDPLKLIIMSATLRVEDFVENTRLFKIKPPLIKVESRQFPVTIHFNRQTSHNYVLDSIKKAVKIHTKLPEGGILIFLTGQYEVNTVVRKLRKAFPYRRKQWEKSDGEVSGDKKEIDENSGEESEDELSAKEALARLRNKKKLIELPSINLDSYSAVPTDDTQEDLFEDRSDNENDGEWDEEEEDDEDILELHGSSTSQPMWVLPLYSLLPAHKQARVFQRVPEGCRLCVVSTNVAETSLTIPNVKYVVDSGRCKTRMYDKITGVSTFNVTYTSQAGANQRAGRAGRTGPGHCYRLYSSAVFNDIFEKFAVPEIQRKPVDDLLLQMKVMNIVKVVNFPFPSSPDCDQLVSAEKRLRILGALENPVGNKKDDYSSKITALGRSISAFPVAPCFGKMLAISQQENLLKYTVCMVAALSVQEVLIEGLGSEDAPERKKKWLQLRRFWAGTGNSLLLGDPMVLIRAIGAAESAESNGKLAKFCEENGLRPKAIAEIKKLRQQLTNEITLNIPNLKLVIDPNMSPPTDTEAKLLRQIILAGMADRVARKISPEEIEDNQDRSKFKFAYKTIEMEEPVFMHSSCVLRRTLPEWVVYQEIYETNRVYMRGVTAIEPEWLPKFVPSLCTMGEPLADPETEYDEESGKVMCYMSGTFGRAGWELPAMKLEYPTDANGVRWFARFFLEGRVFKKLKRFARFLLANPSTMIKSWGRLVPRTEILTRALLSKGVMSRDKLLEIWENDEHFLLTAYQKWLPESAHTEVYALWPPR